MNCLQQIRNLQVKLASNNLTIAAEALNPFFQPQITNLQAMLKALGVANKKLTQIGTGSHATVYRVSPDLAVKVTSDTQDIQALQKAQRLNSPNIVKLHAVTQQGVSQGIAALIDYVEGPTMVYSTSEMHALIQGDTFSSPAIAKIAILRDVPNIRKNILDTHNLNTKAERFKLSALFKTFAQLESINIPFHDFSENIIDTGNRYVIIDLGQ